MDFQALNAITIHDSFPLLQIEEALQAVKSAVWFTSFDLAQGYLQMAMDEADIHKTAFTLDHQAYMSLVTCLLVYPMLVQAFVTSWRCALGINNT